MNVEFVADDPKKKARPILDQILSRGVDQLAVACAFCTAAGVEFLLRHANQLGNAESFVVIGADWPTDYVALAELHHKIPGRVFVHWGKLTPVEKKAGAALMHSKVFYARAGRECWLWTGSHNLTVNAIQGGNCEAAVILHGTADEKPFVDAMQHLLACRSQATSYDPNAPPPGSAQRVDILAVHAEADPAPAKPLPWHVHLCLDSPEFDHLLEPPADVRLFCYPKGSLINGWQSATPSAAFSGSLTGKNLTATNPRARRAGTAAEWGAATFGITESMGLLVVTPARPPGPSVTTQGIIHIDAASDPGESLFSEEPKVKTELIPGEVSLSDVDSDMRRFFQNNSLQGSMLVHVPFTGRRHVLNLAEGDARTSDLEKIRAEIAPDRDIPVEFTPLSEAKLEKRHPFYRSRQIPPARLKLARAKARGTSMNKKAVGKYVVADPKICHGKLTFKGTRILVADVLDLVAQGTDWETIIRQCHGSITTRAIAEAIRLAGKAFVDHADEYVKESVSS